MLRRSWRIFAFYFDLPDKPRFDAGQIDRPVLRGQLPAHIPSESALVPTKNPVPSDFVDLSVDAKVALPL